MFSEPDLTFDTSGVIETNAQIIIRMMKKIILRMCLCLPTANTYKGYSYDIFTGLYYLQSRYYDPEVGRFINADDVDLLYSKRKFQTMEVNLFAYSTNNFTLKTDHTGLDSTSENYVLIENVLNRFLGMVAFAEYEKYITIHTDYSSNYTKGLIKINITDKDFSNTLYEYFMEDTKGSQTLLAAFALEIFKVVFPWCYEQAYELRAYKNIYPMTTPQRDFLFSDKCVAKEIGDHVLGYLWSLNKPGISLPIFFRGYAWMRNFGFGNSNIKKRKEIIKSCCEVIDVNELDVYSEKQRVGFAYRSGIRDCYKGTNNDPFYDNSKIIRSFEPNILWKTRYIS